MEYSVKKDSWYIINDHEPCAGKISAGSILTTERPVEFYENKSKWKLATNKIAKIVILEK